MQDLNKMIIKALSLELVFFGIELIFRFRHKVLIKTIAIDGKVKCKQDTVI